MSKIKEIILWPFLVLGAIALVILHGMAQENIRKKQKMLGGENN